MNRTIFLSGSISADPDYIKKFEKWEKYWKSRNYTVYNPVKECQHIVDRAIIHSWSEEKLWLTSMVQCINIITNKVDNVFFISDWKISEGATGENYIANLLRKNIIHESELSD